MYNIELKKVLPKYEICTEQNVQFFIPISTGDNCALV